MRIYRRVCGSVSEPAGTVEHIGSGRRVGFTGIEQLLRELSVGARDQTTTEPGQGENPPTSQRT